MPNGAQVSHAGAIRALLEMGVFHALPKDGASMKSSELAVKLSVDELLLGMFTF